MLTKRKRISVKRRVYESEPTHSTNLNRDRRWKKEDLAREKRRTIFDEDIKTLRKRDEEFDQMVIQSFELETSNDWTQKFNPSEKQWFQDHSPYNWDDILELDEDQYQPD